MCKIFLKLTEFIRGQAITIRTMYLVDDNKRKMGKRQKK